MNSDSDFPNSLSRRHFVEKAALLGASAVMSANNAISADPSLSHPPFLTPAMDFYDVSRGNPKPFTLTGQDLIKARLTPESWKLEITMDSATDPALFPEPAKIQTPLIGESALDLPALLQLGKKHRVNYIKAMQCLNISEPLGQGLWEGVPLREVLRLCGRLENVRRIYYRGFHNEAPNQIFQSSLSYTQTMETAPGELPVFLAYRLNGEAIPLERGGPVRMIVPWAYGFKSIKWLQQIFLTNDYRANDTYALKNNDPESFLKTAAYVEGGPEKIVAGRPVSIRGRVISGLSGVDRVEILVRKVIAESKPFGDDDPELLRGEWKSAQIQPAPDWNTVLPEGIASRDLLGFDSKTGEPLSWPLRYGMASWSATISGLNPGRYEIYARSVDRNGFAQPEPRVIRKSGKNMIQFHRVEVG